MRPLIFVLILVTALLVTAEAQAELRVPFGIKGGINWATWDWGSLPTPEGNTNYHGYQIGAFVEFDFDFFISIELDALYSMRGTKIDMGRDEAQFDTGYFDFPLLVKYTFELEYSRPYFVLGPSFNILNSAEFVSGSDSEVIKNSLEAMEIGMVAGFGIHMKSILLEGRYHMGMTDVSKTDGITSSSWSANFGISF